MNLREKNRPQRWLVMTAAGTEFGVAVATCLWAGNWLDRNLWAGFVQTSGLPIGMLVGTILGFAIGLYTLLRLLSWANDEGDNVDSP